MVVPNSSINVLSGVPLDKNYDNIVAFTSKTEQANQMLSKSIKSFNNCTFLREEDKNFIRVECDSSEIYTGNYLMFQNKNHGGKWFYAFINKVVYVNENTTKIEYEMDSVSTWWFDIEFRESFVEREHVVDDRIGEHLIDEGLELGQKVFSNYEKVGISELESCVIVASTVGYDLEPVQGQRVGGLYSGITYLTFSSLADLNNWLTALTSANKSESIVTMFMGIKNHFETTGDIPFILYSRDKERDTSSLGGFVPKNNKLFTYPYNCLYMTTCVGETTEFRYEFFREYDEVPRKPALFRGFSEVDCDPKVSLAPLAYKGVEVNYNEQLVLEGFPQLAYNIDTFKAWLAQNKYSIGTSMLSDSVQMVASGATANISGVTSGLGGVLNSFGKIYDTTSLPPKISGQATSSGMFAYGELDFHVYQSHITKEYAEIIDNFFEVYGYKVNELKVPQLRSRPYWNYLKLNVANIIGKCPDSDLQTIKSVFMNGVTLWSNLSNVGNYSLNNH